jgi:hypothetical protein
MALGGAQCEFVVALFTPFFSSLEVLFAPPVGLPSVLAASWLAELAGVVKRRLALADSLRPTGSSDAGPVTDMPVPAYPRLSLSAGADWLAKSRANATVFHIIYLRSFAD